MNIHSCIIIIIIIITGSCASFTMKLQSHISADFVMSDVYPNIIEIAKPEKPDLPAVSA